MSNQTTAYTDSSSAPYATISGAIDRCHEQIEACSDPATTSAWQQVLEGLEVTMDYDERIEDLETDVQTLGVMMDKIRERLA